MPNLNVKGGPRVTLPRQLDATLLELFDGLHRTGNLTVTGAQLGLSQPAVSRGLARLREIYDDPLFVRQQRGVAATPLALELVAPIAAALQTLRATFRREGFDPATEARQFQVAMSDIGERLFLPRLMDHLARVAPRIEVQVVSPSQGTLADRLAAGQIDLAAGFFGTLGKQFHQRRLFRERFVYIARSDHKQVRGSLQREQLRELPHVIGAPEGTDYAAAVEKVLSGARVKARIALRVHSFLCVGPVVARTALIAPLPSNLAAEVAGHMDLQLLEPPVKFPGFDVSLSWHQRFNRDPASMWLRGVFTTLFASRDTAPPLF